MKPITLFYLMQTMDYCNNLEESEFVIVDEDNNEYRMYSILRKAGENTITLKIRKKEK